MALNVTGNNFQRAVGAPTLTMGALEDPRARTGLR
jgi:hypothetical protein